MKRFFLLFAIVAVATSCSSSVEKREAPVRQGYSEDLFGDVESITVETLFYNEMSVTDTIVMPSKVDVYTFNDKGDLAEWKHNDMVDNNSWRKKCTYNADDRLVLEEMYRGNVMSWRTRYRYDAEGRMVEQLTNQINEGKDIKYLYLYDEFGNQIESKCYLDGWFRSKSVMKYDEQGREIESAFYDKLGAMLEQRFSVYDKNGNLAEYMMLRFDPTTSYTRSCYELDKAGNVVKSFSYNKEGEMTGYGVNSYDEEGRCVELSSFEADGTQCSRHTYKYDAQGNVVEYTYYRGRSVYPNYILRNTIVYRSEAAE